MTRQKALAQGINYYFTGKPCKFGHLAKRRTHNCECWECGRDGYKIRSARAYVRNTDKYKERARNFYFNNLAQEKKKRAIYRKNNKEIFNKYFNNRYHTNIDYRISVCCRRMVSRCMEKMRKKKEFRTFDKLGYSVKDLKENIQAKFRDGMGWENYGKWHIDHIKPVVAFVREGITDVSVINALNNLQPLWAEENIRKRDAITYP